MTPPQSGGHRRFNQLGWTLKVGSWTLNVEVHGLTLNVQRPTSNVQPTAHRQTFVGRLASLPRPHASIVRWAALFNLIAASLCAQQVVPPAVNADLAALKAKAYQLYDAKDYTGAAAQFQTYLTRQSGDVRALFDYAGILAELNRLEEAARQLELLHQQRPQHEAGYFQLGIIYVRLGRAADAQQVFTQLQQSTNPDMAAAAREALQKSRGEQAQAARFQAETHAFELAHEQKHAEVLAAVVELEKQQQPSFPLQLQRLYSMSALKQYQDALARAEKLAETHPTAPDLALVRGDLLAELQRRPEAERIWRQVMERNPGTSAAVEAARRLNEKTVPPPEDHVYELVRQDQHREALAAIAALESQGQLSLPMQMQRVYCLQALGEKEEALATANEIAKQNPASGDLTLIRADLLVQRHEWFQAGSILKELKLAQPDSPAAQGATERLVSLPPVANLDKWYWGEAYASGDYLGRYGTIVGSGFVRQGTYIPGARWLQPYGELRFSVDTHSGQGARETVISDNAIGFYGGARIQLLSTEYLFVYAEGGLNKDFLDHRDNGDWAPDYQAGIYGYKSWGPGTLFHKESQETARKHAAGAAENSADTDTVFWRGDWFVDAGANFSYYRRYRSAIGYAQAHEGFRLAQIGPKVVLDGYVIENLTWDVRGNYFDNFFDLGPGARIIWQPHPNWQVVLSGEWLAGFYFGRDDLNTRGHASAQYDGAHVSLSVGARW